MKLSPLRNCGPLRKIMVRALWFLFLSCSFLKCGGKLDFQDKKCGQSSHSSDDRFFNKTRYVKATSSLKKEISLIKMMNPMLGSALPEEKTYLRGENGESPLFRCDWRLTCRACRARRARLRGLVGVDFRDVCSPGGV